MPISMNSGAQRVGVDFELNARAVTSAAFSSVQQQLKDIETGVGRTNTTLGSTDQTLNKMYGGLRSAAGLMGVAFSVQALAGFVGGVFDAASEIKDMAANLDISTDAAQEFKFAADQTGTTMTVVGSAIAKMNLNLSEGGKGTVAALKAAGLGFSEIRNMRPEDAFKAIASAIKEIEDPMTQQRVAQDLLGKSSKDLLAGIREDFVKVGEGAAKMSKETIDRLEEAQDAWGKLADKVTIYSGTIIAEGMRTAEQVTSSWKGFLKFAEDALEFGTGAALANANAFAKVNDSLGKQDGKWGAGAAFANTIRKTKEEIDALEKSQRAGASAAEAHRKAIGSLADRLSGQGAIRDVSDMAEAVKRLGGLSQVTEDGIRKIVAALDEALKSTKPLPPEVQRLGLELMRLGQLEPPLTRGMANLWREIEQVGEVAQDTNAWARMLAEDGIKAMTVGSQEGGAAFGQMLTGLKEAQKELKPTTEKVKDYGLAFDTAAQFAGMFSGVLGDGISIVGQYASAVSAANAMTDATAKSHAQAAAAQQLTTSGMMIYFQFIMSQMAAQDAARAQGLAFAEQLADVNDQLREQYGSFADAQAAAERYGLALDDVRTKYMTITAAGTSRTGPSGPNDAREVDRFNDQVRDLDEMVKRVASNVERLGLAWTDMPKMEDRLRAAALAAREFITDIDELTRAGYDYDAIVNAMSVDVNEWLSNALAAGVGISDAMRPIIDALIRTGELTDANAMKLLGYVGGAIPSIEEIRAAAEKYGLSWEEVEAILARVAEATRKATDKSALSEMDELLKGSGFKSMAEREKIAGNAGRVYAEMVRLGGFSASEMARAFKAWQDALGAINPALEDTAKALEKVGKKADGLTDALREELKGLTDMVDKEALEEDMGSIEKAARARIEAIQRVGKEAAKATMKIAVDAEATLTAGASSSMAITGGVVKSTIKSMRTVGEDGKVAFEWVRDAAWEADDKIKGCWERSNDFKELLDTSDFGAPFRDMASDVRDTKSDVDDLLRSLSGIPGGGTTSSRDSSYTGSSSESDFRSGSPFRQAQARTASGGSPIVVQANVMLGRQQLGQAVFEILPDQFRARGVL